jgi:hypothetical protein
MRALRKGNLTVVDFVAEKAPKNRKDQQGPAARSKAVNQKHLFSPKFNKLP